MSTPTRIAWSVDGFAAFWSNPDPAYVPPLLTEDVVGVWPGTGEPVRGREAYTKVLAEVIELMPDLRLEVAEHATNGEYTFVRWIMHATGANGPFEMSGVDRIRLRDGLVCENVIRLDRAEFEERSGLKAPFAG
ncbi:MAG TPA: nuclear transport factor 2 family protein [Solirubrobacteraceae bacterium]